LTLWLLEPQTWALASTSSNVGKVHTYIYTHKTPKGPKTGADFCFQAKENVLRFRTISLLPGKSTQPIPPQLFRWQFARC